MGEDKIIRQHLTFYGRVQGVGFRYRAHWIADELGLTGWVRNTLNDTVEMELQGTQEQIADMISRLNRQKWIYIDDITFKDIPVVEERSFRVMGGGW